MSRYSHASKLETNSCTIELDGGRFCDAEGAPDMPFSICAHHAIQLYRRMHSMVTAVQQGDPREHLETHQTVMQSYVDARRERQRSHSVYYVRVGPLIKIGYTSDVRQRLSHYPPGSELLATERGGEDVETRRLRQFRHLLAERKEWFHPGADLLAHIAKLTA